MMLRAVFARYPRSYRGFYVDVGAHHPTRFSNTRHFYEQRWNGICVDPLPGAARRFARTRPRDIFVPAGVGGAQGTMTYYLFDEPALNTFLEKTARENPGRVRGRMSVDVMPLRTILDRHLPNGRVIDFLSVDVEGLDLEVLRSNDWRRYRPRAVVIEEMATVTLGEIASLDASVFLAAHGYAPVGRLPSALLLLDTRSPAYEGGAFLQYVDENGQAAR